jgi:hypothetical protein
MGTRGGRVEEVDLLALEPEDNLLTPHFVALANNKLAAIKHALGR